MEFDNAKLENKILSEIVNEITHAIELMMTTAIEM